MRKSAREILLPIVGALGTISGSACGILFDKKSDPLMMEFISRCESVIRALASRKKPEDVTYEDLRVLMINTLKIIQETLEKKT